MAANQRPAPRSRNFGRIDPICWPAIGSLLVVAVILAFGDAAEFAIIPVVFAILIAVLDSWTNRPKPGDEDRRVRTTGSNRRIADTPPPPSRVQRRPAADRMPPRANPRTAAPRANPAAN